MWFEGHTWRIVDVRIVDMRIVDMRVVDMRIVDCEDRELRVVG